MKPRIVMLLVLAYLSAAAAGFAYKSALTASHPPAALSWIILFTVCTGLFAAFCGILYVKHIERRRRPLVR